jgi:hypothetical protein
MQSGILVVVTMRAEIGTKRRRAERNITDTTVMTIAANTRRRNADIVRIVTMASIGNAVIIRIGDVATTNGIAKVAIRTRIDDIINARAGRPW